MSTILFDIEDGVARITLNRPDRLNAFDGPTARLLQARLDECASLHEVRAVLLTGAGKGFCAGQDLAEVADPQGPPMSAILAEHYNPVVRKIRTMPKPVLAAVNGVAAGAGANIALCCDVVVAARSATFIQAFAHVGLIPDSGGTWTLPRLIGWQKASALMMLGDKVDATEAERLGMIYRVLPDEGFAEAAISLARRLADMPTRALARTKHALQAAFTNDLDTQLALEDRLQQAAALTYDHREGVEAFLTKRKPVFRGE
jgi:2-(1,2-epoxy-1,2-dihydrophenyl)acetyl-CoA isomerase